MARDRIVIVSWNVEKSINWEYLYGTLAREFDIHFVLLNRQLGSYWATFLKRMGVPVYEILYRNIIKDGVGIVYRLRELFKYITPRVVHAHLRDAVWLSALATRGLKDLKFIVTRHYGISNWQYPHAVLLDKLAYQQAELIIAVSPVVKEIIEKELGGRTPKIIIIPHGIDIKLFNDVSENKVFSIRRKYGYEEGNPVIGVIMRYLKLKGHEYIINAFKEILKLYPNAKLVLANARGPDTYWVRRLLRRLPAESYVEIPFEFDSPALYGSFDIVVHTPVHPYMEAFGQVYIEALAAGKPLVATPAGIARDWLKHKENAWIVPFKKHKPIVEGIVNILQDPQLRKSLIQGGLITVQEKANIEKNIEGYRQVYRDLLA